MTTQVLLDRTLSICKPGVLVSDHATPGRLTAGLLVQERRGCKIAMKSWPATRHVEHYREDPAAYTAAIDSFFLENCENWRAPTSSS